MTRTSIVLTVACAALLAGPSPLRAQVDRAPSLDVTVGVARPNVGRYTREFGEAVDIAGAMRLTARRPALIVAAALSVQGTLGTTKCSAPGGLPGCPDNLPAVTSLTALAGWELGARTVASGGARPLGSARIMAGPGIYWVDARGGFEETRNFGGFTARVDLATRSFWRTGFLASGRVAWIPGFTPGRGTQAIGVGVRLQ